MNIEHKEIFVSKDLKGNMNKKGIQDNIYDEGNKSDDMCYEDLGSNVFESDCEVYPQVLKNERNIGNEVCKENCEVYPQVLKNERNIGNEVCKENCEVYPQVLKNERSI
ncbi:unnamed protein product, partial [Brenthis ino]